VRREQRPEEARQEEEFRAARAELRRMDEDLWKEVTAARPSPSTAGALAGLRIGPPKV